MSKAVLMSIQPKWVEKIARGEKTIEVRKTKPKLETPFKAYIYETQGKTDTPWIDEDGHLIFKGRGQIIGEFVCDRIDDFSKWEFDYPSLLRHINLFAGTNGDYKFLDYYLKGQKKGYGWNISGLKIYDKPKELSEFKRWNRTEENSPCAHTKWLYPDCKDCKECNLIRPPQSWCYVED